MDSRTIDTYNKMAHEYDEETVVFWETFPRDFFDAFASLTKGPVLDIGSGPARDALILKERGLDVTCFDASEAMIEISRAQGFHSVLGDVMHLPFADNFFGAVWAYTSLIHVPKKDIDTAFSEIKRVLAPRGVLGLGFIEGNTEEYRESSGVTMPRLFSYYTQEELEGLLQKHGFEIITFQEFKPKSKKYLNIIAKSI